MWQQIVECTAAPEVAFCIPWFNSTALPIYWYGILASVGIFVGAFYAAKHVEMEGEDSDIVWDALLWVLIAGLIGARLWYVLAEVMGQTPTGQEFNLTSWAGFVNIINPRGGGMNIFGGAIAGLAAAYAYARFRKIDGWLLTDAGLMGLLLGQAIGRIGNFINQELYGPPTGSEWFGMTVRPDHRLAEFAGLSADTRFHPTMLYELVWLLVTFGVLFYLFRRYQDRAIRGMITGSYLVMAGIGRFIMEFWRPDQPTFILPGLQIEMSISRLLSMLYVIVGLIILLDRQGHVRIPFIRRPQTAKQRAQSYQDILVQRRRQQRASERERVREQRRKEREQRTTAAQTVDTPADTPTSES